MSRDIKKIYFIGIGGIGMSAIARYMISQGAEVYGYDRKETVLTRKLAAEGMIIHYDDDPKQIPEGVELVVYTPAIPTDHKELIWFRSNGYDVVKRSEMLGVLSESKKTIAVAGTHGKTSTSSTIAHILTHGNYEVSAFIGGIMSNYDSNYIEGSGDWIVLEADEYDRSFLKLRPNISIVISMDADHLDIYGEEQSMVDSFNKFIQLTAVDGQLILKHELRENLTVETVEVLKTNRVEVITYGVQAEADVMICKVVVKDEHFDFALLQGDVVLTGLTSKMPGRHNVENATAALIASMYAGASYQDVKQGLESFKGIKRRFELIHDSKSGTYIDDYAHHPTELKAAISAARELYSGRKILGIFQPHLYSRTRDFAYGFAKELDELDEVILLDVYPARELPIEGVSSQLIYEKMKLKSKTLTTKEKLMSVLVEKEIDVIITLGAGDIDLFVPQIREWLEQNKS